MNKQIKIVIFMLTILTAVGFAAITMTLSQTGTATINGVESNFTDNIQFDAVDLDEISKNSGASINIAADRKSFSFTTQSLTTLGESVEITYSIRNKSQYGAKIGALTCTTEGDAKEYITAQENNNYQGRVIKPNKTSCTDSVLIFLNKSYADEEESSIKVTCKLNATATDYDPSDDSTQTCDN